MYQLDSLPTVSTDEYKKQERLIQILLVEDEVIAAKIVKSLLVSLGCSVDIAPNGKSALKQVNDHGYDLVLLDVGLPDISGIDVAKQIRAWNKHLPIIALTAHVNEKKEEYLQFGIQQVISKPLSEETAIRMLATFVRK